MLERRGRPVRSGLLVCSWLVLVAVAGVGCSNPSAGAHEPSLGELLRLWRGAAALEAGSRGVSEVGVTRAWTATGHGRALGVEVQVRLAGDSHGRYHLSLDGPISYAEVSDGTSVWRRALWDRVHELSGWEREVSQLTQWVIGGYWLDPGAPVDVSRSDEAVADGRIGLVLSMPEGRARLLLEVEEESGFPRRVVPLPARGAGVLDLRFARHHRLEDGRVVPGEIRYRQNAAEMGVLRIDPPALAGTGPTKTTAAGLWKPPAAAAKTSFDAEASDELEVRRHANGLLYVPLWIDGRDAGWFVLDTGSPWTMVDAAVRDRLGLRSVGRGQATGVGGSVATPVHRVESVRIGPMEVRSVPVGSADLSSLGAPPGLPLGGVVGMDLLGRGILEVQTADATVALHDPKGFTLPRGAWVPMLQVEGKPVMAVTLEGHGAHLNLDTGATSGLVLGAGLVERLGLLEGRSIRPVTVGGVGGRVPGHRGTVDWIELGGRRVDRVPTFFASETDGALGAPYPDGLAGVGLLDDFRLVVDTGRRRIAFLRPETPRSAG